MTRAGVPIVAAYEQTSAGAVECGACGAVPGEWCRDRHGRTTRVPHVVRIAAARPLAAQASDRLPPSTAHQGSPSRPLERDSGGNAAQLDFPMAHDPSEPRHPRPGED